MPHKVLIVDDSEEWLEAAVELFSRAGYTVRGAATFPEAQKALDSFNPDLLVTDIRLKEYNGLYLLVRSRHDHPRMAAVIVSAYDDPVLARDARLQGANDFLIKPIDPDLLLQRAAEALANRGKRRWPRKSLPVGVVAEVEGQQARLVDVSYGGVRLELPFTASVGLPLEIVIPSFSRSVNATAVWVHDGSAGTRECGAALKMDEQMEGAWRQMVDALASPV